LSLDTVGRVDRLRPSPAYRAPDIPGRTQGSWLARHPLLRCLAIYRQIPGLFALCSGLFIITHIVGTAQQHLIGRAVHDLELGRAVVRLADGSLQWTVAYRWVVLLIVVAFGRGLLQYTAGVLALIVGQELLSRLRVSILVQVQRLDLAFHQRHGVGEMVTRTTRDADKVRDALISVWRNVVETALVVVGSLALLTWYAPVLALGPIVAVVAGLTWLLRHTEPLVRLDRAVGEAFDSVNQDLAEGIYGVRAIKAFGLESDRVRRFTRSVSTFVASAKRALAYASRHIPVPQVIVALGQVWVLIVGAYLVKGGRIDTGSLLASLLMMNTVILRVETVGRTMQVFADARSSAARIMELLDADPVIESGAAEVPTVALGIRLDHVRVRSPGGVNDVLCDCSLQANPGDVIALVGATGAGKSTLTGLLPRLVEADSGQVLIGSDEIGWRSVRDYDLQGLRRQVHVVPQEVFLFSDTVAANLRVGARQSSEEELWSALRLACADEIVRELPEGLATVIGDRGVTLSGGQRQRLTLARAFVADPDVLVLDDATSALDAITERAILDGLRAHAAARGRPLTVVIVASKPSTVLLADQVFLLADGRIAAAGKHSVLLRQDIAYRDLMGAAHAA
jgi:ABC-type multidrug transport system fused ATPase/permease subunit